jgi:hypothetical protein
LGSGHAQEEKELFILFWLEIIRKRQLGKARSRWQYNNKNILGDTGFKVMKWDKWIRTLLIRGLLLLL